MTYKEICGIADRIKRRSTQVRSPFDFCPEHGILLNALPLGTGEGCIKGFITEARRIKCITYNSDLPKREQEQIVWHELGHAFLHPMGAYGYTDILMYDSNNQKEKEANLFSAEMQLDDERVLEALNEDVTFFTAASILEVPMEVLDFKFRLLKWKGYKICEPPIYTSGNYLRDFEMEKEADDYS